MASRNVLLGLVRPHGHSAKGAFTEAFTFDCEGMIEAGTMIFPGNGHCQFHELRFGEFLFKFGKEVFVHGDGDSGELIGVAQDAALGFGE